MLFKREIRGMIWAFVFLSLGGLLLHIRIHPPAKSAYNWIPIIFGVVNAFVLPFLFNHARTVAWAYLLNVLTVVIGVSTMTHFSIVHWEGPVTIGAVLLKTTLADNFILLAKLPIGHVILRHFRPPGRR